PSAAQVFRCANHAPGGKLPRSGFVLPAEIRRVAKNAGFRGCRGETGASWREIRSDCLDDVTHRITIYVRRDLLHTRSCVLQSRHPRITPAAEMNGMAEGDSEVYFANLRPRLFHEGGSHVSALGRARVEVHADALQAFGPAAQRSVKVRWERPLRVEHKSDGWVPARQLAVVGDGLRPEGRIGNDPVIAVDRQHHFIE